MSFLLDTDIVSAFTKTTMPARLRDFFRANDGDCFISILTVAEMRHGLPGVDDPKHAALAERLARTEIIFVASQEALDVDVLITWKKLLAKLKSINRTMSCEDSLIAATAINRGYTLATNNTRHFAPATRFGLDMVNPLEG